jgi:hypothetical protein
VVLRPPANAKATQYCLRGRSLEGVFVGRLRELEELERALDVPGTVRASS